MYYNNKGSVLIYILIVFSVVSTITMMCIGLNYSNSKISILNHQSLVIKESLLSSIEIVHSNILKEVSIAIENSDTEEEFKEYFQGNEFKNNIKSISNSKLENITIKIPTNIICDSNGLINFKIESIFKKDNCLKKYSASVNIDTNLENYKEFESIKILDSSINLEKEYEFNDVEINEETIFIENKDKTSINPSDLVKVYDYKEI